MLMCECVVLVGDFNVPTRDSHSITPNIKVSNIPELDRMMAMKGSEQLLTMTFAWVVDS